MPRIVQPWCNPTCCAQTACAALAGEPLPARQFTWCEQPRSRETLHLTLYPAFRAPDRPGGADGRVAAGNANPNITLRSLNPGCCAQIDQAALTGESLPAKKFSGDVAFSGSAIKQGERHAVVYATGANTFFGRAANLIGSTHNVANIQKVSP